MECKWKTWNARVARGKNSHGGLYLEMVAAPSVEEEWQRSGEVPELSAAAQTGPGGAGGPAGVRGTRPHVTVPCETAAAPESVVDADIPTK